MVHRASLNLLAVIAAAACPLLLAASPADAQPSPYGGYFYGPRTIQPFDGPGVYDGYYYVNPAPVRRRFRPLGLRGRRQPPVVWGRGYELGGYGPYGPFPNFGPAPGFSPYNDLPPVPGAGGSPFGPPVISRQLGVPGPSAFRPRAVDPFLGRASPSAFGPQTVNPQLGLPQFPGR